MHPRTFVVQRQGLLIRSCTVVVKDKRTVNRNLRAGKQYHMETVKVQKI